MRTALAGAALALALASCAVRPPSPDAFSFAVVGDAPYGAGEAFVFEGLLENLNAEPLAFVVHVGDFKSGTSDCSDALYADRKALFDRIAKPFVLVLGDNDWTDCRRTAAGSRDPLERLAKVREVFFTGPRMPGTVVQPGFPENRFWITRGVVFVTLNLPGSNNNRGFERASDLEADRRDAANLDWLGAASVFAHDPRHRGLVVIAHANPFAAEKTGVYDAYLEALKKIATQLGKPVLLIHGDTHWQRDDRPFKDASGKTIANLQRLESYGSPFMGWVRVTVDPAGAALFTFQAKGAS